MHTDCFSSWAKIEGARPIEGAHCQSFGGSELRMIRNELAAKCEVPTHTHPVEVIAFVVSGRIEVGLGAPGSIHYVRRTLGPGDIVRVPRNLPHDAKVLADTVLIEAAVCPSETGV
jgi:quercetin dioxygenase-like cupin family protein